MPNIIEKQDAEKILQIYNKEQQNGGGNTEMGNIIHSMKRWKSNQNGGSNQKYNFHDSLLELKHAFRKHYFS